VAEHLWFILQAVLRCDHLKRFVVQPQRQVMERTVSWLSKDSERLATSSKVMISTAMTRLMLR